MRTATTLTDSRSTAPRKTVDPELLTADEVATQKRLETLAWLFDRSIPIPFLNFRIGLDPILGLIPGIGDFVSAIMATYLMAEASRLGASRSVLMKMGSNVLLDAAFGTVPVVGDLFDAAYKANTKNVKLLSEHLKQPDREKSTGPGIVVVIAIAMFGTLTAVFVLTVVLIAWLLQQF